jgi:GT2 family glycosyltransferase
LLLAVPADAAAGGWFLLRGTVLRRGGDYDARLYFDLGSGWSRTNSIPVPSTVKGVIREVLRLPAGVRQLVFHPGAAAHCEVGAMKLSRIPAWQLRWQLTRAAVPGLWQHPRAKRQSIGLTWPRLLLDPSGAAQRAGRLRAHAAAPRYEDWVREFDTLQPEDRAAIERDTAGWRDAPAFEVLLTGDDASARSRSLASLEAQWFRGFHCTQEVEPGGVQRFQERLAAAGEGTWAMLLRAGDLLPAHALYWLGAAARSAPEAAMLYADEDELDAEGVRCRPRFKPDWSWSHARSTAFFGEAVALRASLLARAGGVVTEDLRHGSYAAALRVMETGGHAVHIPAILLHRAADAPTDQDAWAVRAVREHLRRAGEPAVVELLQAGVWRVRHMLPPRPPLVTIVVPTRDALQHTRLCIESLRQRTRYPAYEVLLVDNGSSEPETLAWMREQAADPAVRVLRDDGPFNYAAINNRAVDAARGDLVCLLNNDTEVIDPDWLDEMVGRLLQPGVDVVGAKLLYPDGRVQHAGDLLGVGGIANHAHAWIAGDAPGYCDRALVAQEFSAVTAACLITHRNRYLALGGLDEVNLPVGFNDVDYCLRVREAGGAVVWTPHARLIHHESVSRGRDLTPQRRRRAMREAAYMRARWGPVLARDPFYNPNLSQERADFSLSPAPLVRKPWKA